MARHTLYAYVDGADLEDIAVNIESRCDQFVRSRQWKSPTVSVVNEKGEPEPGSLPDDLPPWNLGLNLELPDPGTETAGWFTDIDGIALFLAELFRLTHRGFVIGIYDHKLGFAEDLFVVDSLTPDLKQLKEVIGAGPVS